MIRPGASLLLLALAATAQGQSLRVSCDTGPAGLSSIVIESQARIDVRSTDAGMLVEVEDPGEDVAAGGLRCPPARGVQVLPGRVTGLDVSRIVVTLGRGEPPRVVRAEGRVRLLWLPPAAAAGAATPPMPRAEGSAADAETASRRASASEARPWPEPERERLPEPIPQRLPEASVIASPRDFGRTDEPRPQPLAPPARDRGGEPGPSDPSLPPDFLLLDRPVAMVASVETELRGGPGRRFPPSTRLTPGDRITVDGRAGDWIRTNSGPWAFGPYFEAPEEALSGGAFLARIEAIHARVHAGPAAHHEIVAELYRGEQVVVDEVKTEWAHVRDGGWIRLAELTRVDEARR